MNVALNATRHPRLNVVRIVKKESNRRGGTIKYISTNWITPQHLPTQTLVEENDHFQFLQIATVISIVFNKSHSLRVSPNI